MRERDPHDRRRTPLAITAAGQEVLARIPAVAETDTLAQAVAGLAAGQATQLGDLLRTIVVLMDGNDGRVRAIRARFAATNEDQLDDPA